MKFCELSWILISNWTWKFQLSILKNKKVLFLKEYFLSRTAKIDPKDGVSHSNFHWRFWPKWPSWNHSKPFQQSRQQELRAYCSNIHTVIPGSNRGKTPLKSANYSWGPLYRRIGYVVVLFQFHIFMGGRTSSFLPWPC